MTKNQELIPDPLNKDFNDIIYDKFKDFYQMKKDEGGNLCICPKCNDYCNKLSEQECNDNTNTSVKNNKCVFINNKCVTNATKPYCESCTSKTAKIFKMFQYQEFLYKYMELHNKSTEDYFNHDSLNSRGVLIYHGLGSGKTCSGVLLAEACRTYKLKPNPTLPSKNIFKRKVIFMIPANLFLDPWIKDLSGYCNNNEELRNELKNATDKNIIEKKNPTKMREIYINICKKYNYYIIHYNAENPEGKGGWIDKLKEIPTRYSDSSEEKWQLTNRKDYSINPFDDSVVIIDEVHNIMNSIARGYEDGSVNKIAIYKHLFNASNAKTIFLSGTPMVNRGLELAFLFNLLRGNINHKGKQLLFETNEDVFNNLFFDSSYKMINKDLFSRRINGLVSYYKGIDDTVFAKKIIENKMLFMKGNQKDVYLKMYEYEKLDAKLKSQSKLTSVQSGFPYTRQTSNFTFPPYVFDKNMLLELKKQDKLLFDNSFPDRPVNELVVPYAKTSNNVLQGFVKPSDKEHFNRAFKLLQINKDKPLQGEKLKLYSIKMYHILQYIKKSNGPVLVYSYFVDYSIDIFAEVLNQNGFSNYDDSNSNDDKPKYMLWTGKSKNDDNKNIFNLYENRNGNIIKVFLLTTAGKEGISLFGIRQIHILEPFFHNVLDRQVIGRGVRICSHSHIPENDFIDFSSNPKPQNKNKRIVNIFKWHAYIDKRSIPSSSETSQQKQLRIQNERNDIIKSSTDHKLMTISNTKFKIEEQIMMLLQNNAIDCKLNKYSNCFKSLSNISDFKQNWFLTDNFIKNDKFYNIFSYFKSFPIHKYNLLTFSIDQNINLFINKFNFVNAIIYDKSLFQKAKLLNINSIINRNPLKYISLNSNNFNKLFGDNFIIYMNSNISDNIHDICNKISTKSRFILIFNSNNYNFNTSLFIKKVSIIDDFILIDNNKNSNNFVSYIFKKLAKHFNWNSKTILYYFYNFIHMNITSKDILIDMINNNSFLNNPNNLFSYQEYISLYNFISKKSQLNNDYQKLLSFIFVEFKNYSKFSDDIIYNLFKIIDSFNIHSLNDLSCNIKNLNKKISKNIIDIIIHLLNINKLSCNQQEWLDKIAIINNKIKK